MITLSGNPGRLKIAAAGGADRRSAKNADAPIDQSRKAHHPAWPLHSPEGGPEALAACYPFQTCRRRTSGGHLEVTCWRWQSVKRALPLEIGEGQAGLQSPRRATVVAVTVLDITGIIVTVAAAVILTLTDEADRRWWWAVGMASLVAVFTTALLIRIADQRRSFIEASLRLAQQLEDLEQRRGELPIPLLELAMARHNAALASGDIALADRLAILISRHR